MDYKSIKAGVSEEAEIIVWGSLQTTSNVIRSLAKDLKALIAMSRDPVSAGYVKLHGAQGGISLAIDLGKAYLRKKEEDAYSKIETVTNYLGGEILIKGKIVENITEAKGGFDIGLIIIKANDETYQLSYVNEYMTLEKNGERLATFPDLITSFNLEGKPITSASIKKNDQIVLIKVPKENIPIGDGNRYHEIYEPIESAIGKPMIKYLKNFLLK